MVRAPLSVSSLTSAHAMCMPWAEVSSSTIRRRPSRRAHQPQRPSCSRWRTSQSALSTSQTWLDSSSESSERERMPTESRKSASRPKGPMEPSSRTSSIRTVRPWSVTQSASSLSGGCSSRTAGKTELSRCAQKRSICRPSGEWVSSSRRRADSITPARRERTLGGGVKSTGSSSSFSSAMAAAPPRRRPGLPHIRLFHNNGMRGRAAGQLSAGACGRAAEGKTDLTPLPGRCNIRLQFSEMRQFGIPIGPCWGDSL